MAATVSETRQHKHTIKIAMLVSMTVLCFGLPCVGKIILLEFSWRTCMADEGTTNAALIGVGTLSITTFLGAVGSLIWKYKEKLCESVRCVITFGGPDEQEEDVEMGTMQQRGSRLQPIPTPQPMMPQISFPISIINTNPSSGEVHQVSLPFISPFEQVRHRRSHSDPTVSSSATSSDADSNSSGADEIVFRSTDLHDPGYMTA